MYITSLRFLHDIHETSILLRSKLNNKVNTPTPPRPCKQCNSCNDVMYDTHLLACLGLFVSDFVSNVVMAIVNSLNPNVGVSVKSAKPGQKNIVSI